jgi:hypothetical protein
MSKFLTVIAFFITVIACAQPVKFEESAAFPEPREGFLRLMQLSNGNTALLHFMDDDRLNLKLFGPDRKTIVDKIIQLKFPGKGMSIASVINIGNEIVVFGGKAKDMTPTMYRATIDAATGNLKKTEEVGQLKKMNMGDMFAFMKGPFGAGGDVPFPRIEVKKDPKSDNYAVVLFNSLAADRSKRIEIIHFGSDHQELSRAFFTSPDYEGYKYMELIDFVVLGDSKVLASAFVFNKKGENSYLAVCSLKKGESKVVSKVLPTTKDMEITHGLMRYNKTENVVAIVGLDFVKERRSTEHYQSVFAMINPDNLELVMTKMLSLPAVDSEYKKIFGEKKRFNGVPLDLYINEDNTYSIVFQDITTRITYGSHSTNIKVELGSIAVAHLNSKAIETTGYLVPMGQSLNYSMVLKTAGLDYGPMYVARRNESSQTLRDGLQFKSFSYLNGENGNYILFNDLRENLDRIKEGKINAVTSVSDTDAFITTLKDGVSKKEFLFGDAGPKVFNFAMIPVSTFDRASGTFATLKMENDKGKKMKVVWAKL